MLKISAVLLSVGVVWCGVVWYGVVWCGVVWCAYWYRQLELAISCTYSYTQSQSDFPTAREALKL